MVKNKILTKADLINTLKEAGVATKDDVRQIVGEEITRRKLVVKDDLKNFATKDDITKSEKRMERRLVIRMNNMEKNLQQSISNLAETTPTRSEFEVLKRQSQYGLA